MESNESTDVAFDVVDEDFEHIEQASPSETRGCVGFFVSATFLSGF